MFFSVTTEQKTDFSDITTISHFTGSVQEHAYQNLDDDII